MLRLSLAILSLSPVLVAQAAAPGEQVPDVEFPAFANGDGRQQLSQFRGEPVLVCTFSDVWGGTAASDKACKLKEQHDELVVILMHTEGGGTFGDAAKGVDLGAWAMRRYPGADVRLCPVVKSPPWQWQNTGKPPYFAVVGADGRLVAVGTMEKGSRALEEAVDTAIDQFGAGWGDGDEPAVRKLLYKKGDLGAARSKAPVTMLGEVRGVFARRCAVVEWLLDDGQWLRAKEQLDELTQAAEGDEEWTAAAAGLAARFTADEGKQELELAGKLQRLLKPLAKKGPDKNVPKKLREFAEKANGTSVGARAGRLAALTEQAVAVR